MEETKPRTTTRTTRGRGEDEDEEDENDDDEEGAQKRPGRRTPTKTKPNQLTRTKPTENNKTRHVQSSFTGGELPAMSVSGKQGQISG